MSNYNNVYSNYSPTNHYNLNDLFNKNIFENNRTYYYTINKNNDLYDRNNKNNRIKEINNNINKSNKPYYYSIDLKNGNNINENIKKPEIDYKFFNDNNKLNDISSLNFNGDKNKHNNYLNTEINNNKDYRVCGVNNLKIKEIKNQNINKNINQPFFYNKKVIINNTNERYKNLNQIRNLNNLLNSSGSTPTILYNNKSNNKNYICNNMQNERSINYTQKSNNINNSHYSNIANSLSLNIKSNREENEKSSNKILKKGKIHSYSPEIKNNFSCVNNTKENNNYFIYGNNNTTNISNVRPEINLINKENLINYYYNSHSTKIFDEEYKTIKNKLVKNKNRNLIKEIKYKNKKYKLDLDKNEDIGKNKIYKQFINNIFSDKTKFSSLSEKKNMKFKCNFQFDNNNNKSLDNIMPPNDLTDIYKKNLIFSKIFTF